MLVALQSIGTESSVDVIHHVRRFQTTSALLDFLLFELVRLVGISTAAELGVGVESANITMRFAAMFRLNPLKTFTKIFNGR